MAYQEIGNVQTVVLGGVDKATGKRNPVEIEGYLVRSEQRPNKFNPSKPQNYYVFLTSEGERGVYGKAGVDSALRSAKYGTMTKLVATGEVLDTGKGFPMKVFKAMQDSTNALDAAALSTYSEAEVAQSDDEDEHQSNDEYAPEPVVERPKAPVRAATVDASRQAKIQALLNSKK